MEALDEVDEGLLQPLLDLNKVDTSSPFLSTRDELADEFVGQILKTSDTSWGRLLNYDRATPFRVAGK